MRTMCRTRLTTTLPPLGARPLSCCHCGKAAALPALSNSMHLSGAMAAPVSMAAAFAFPWNETSRWRLARRSEWTTSRRAGRGSALAPDRHDFRRAPRSGYRRARARRGMSSCCLCLVDPVPCTMLSWLRARSRRRADATLAWDRVARDRRCGCRGARARARRSELCACRGDRDGEYERCGRYRLDCGGNGSERRADHGRRRAMRHCHHRDDQHDRRLREHGVRDRHHRPEWRPVRFGCGRRGAPRCLRDRVR